MHSIVSLFNGIFIFLEWKRTDRHACDTTTDHKNTFVGAGEAIRVMALSEVKFTVSLGEVDIRGSANGARHCIIGSNEVLEKVRKWMLC